MPTQTFVLTDYETATNLNSFDLRPTAEWTLAGSPDWSVQVQTLHGGESEGVQVVELCNGPLSLKILPTRGMSVWKGQFIDLPLEWKSPVRRPVHPAFINLHDRKGLGWLNGFNELMVRCGLGYQGPPGEDEGTLLTLHGRIGNLPAHHLSLTVSTEGAGSLVLKGVVDEVSMFGPCYRLTSTIRMTAGAADVVFEDVIENIGGIPAPVSLLYHINVGRPFLEAGSRNYVACRELSPREHRSAEGVDQHDIYEGPVRGFVEQAYYYRPAADDQGWSTAVLTNANATAGFAVDYNTRQLPCFVVWKNTQSEAEGYVTGLEPAINFPNFRGFERAQNRLPVLEPGEFYTTSLRWSFAETAEGVSRQIARSQACQQGGQPVIHRTPQPGWSPAGTPAT